MAEALEARDYFASHVFERTLPAVTRRALTGRWKAWIVPLALAPALAVALVLAVPGRLGLPVPSGHDAYGIKGAATLRVFALRDGAVSQVSSGEALAAGDQLRFQIEPAGARYVLIVSVDAQGTVGVYLPFEGTESAVVDGGGTFLSPDSVILDATPGPERVFALFSAKPIRVDTVAPLLETLGRAGPVAIREPRLLPLATEGQVSFLWEKER
jgi:hypothetical protein